MPLIIPPPNITGTVKFYVIDPNGVERDLTRETSPNVFAFGGAIGLGMAEFNIEDDKYPFAPGSLIRHINTDPRTIELPIIIVQSSYGAMLLAVEDLYDWFASGDENGKTPIYLKVVRPDDTIRLIECFYTEGLGGDPSDSGPTWARFVVRLYCPDPNPTGPEDTVVTKTVAQAASFTQLNQGRLPAYPRWKLTGPFTNFEIHNVGSDKSIVGTVVLTAGQFIIVDTRESEFRPGFSVYDHTGANRISILDPSQSDFWELTPGSNNIEVTFGSGTTAATEVELTYLARYRGILR